MDRNMGEYLHQVAKELDVDLTMDFTDPGRVDGGASCGKQIWIFPSKHDWVKELSFWHEVGHVLLSRSMRSRPHYMSTLSKEGAAWEIGLSTAANYGRTWEYDSKEYQWARKHLASYVGGECDDLK
jgi:hypothetical protein